MELLRRRKIDSDLLPREQYAQHVPERRGKGYTDTHRVYIPLEGLNLDAGG
jgi:hypothetical protein